MKLVVISPKCSAASAKKLAAAIGADHINPFAQAFNVKRYDGAINYGCSVDYGFKNIVNHPDAVKKCVDKFLTLTTLHEAGVPVPQFTTDEHKVTWANVVCYKDRIGNNGKGLEYWYKDVSQHPIPNADLYTEVFYAERELRVVVLFGKVFAFHKKEKDGMWDFIPYRCPRSLLLDAQKAAHELGIDYVGFDVLYNSYDSYKFIEANSGPILVDEVIQEFSNYLK